ncbi:hypothetical protein RQP46_011277 [Phenoliferia psychrophenolica]
MRVSLSLRGAIIAVAAFASHGARAYIPAVATSDTSELVQSNDTIHISWGINLGAGGFSARLSRQLTADPEPADNSTVGDNEVSVSILSSSKYAKGVLLHFSEEQTNELSTDVPWIAMISCDSNGTVYTNGTDIFTLARDHGATAALLYTTTAEGCLMNPEYLTPAFDKVLDIYTTAQKSDALIIQNQFAPGVYGQTPVYNYSSQSLNASAVAITELLQSPSLNINGNFPVTTIIAPSSTFLSTISSNTIASDGNPTTTTSDPDAEATSSSPPSLFGSTRRAKRAASATSSSVRPTASAVAVSYLAAVMAASNMAVGANGTTTAASPSSTSSSSNNGPNTGLAMIILYAITGVVTFMFLIVILSGAVRAIRHPERYGPRAALTRTGGGGGRAPQSRAGGLTRAILDTFPVVKFGRSTEAEVRDDEEAPKEVDVELDRMSKEEMSAVVVPSVAAEAEAHEIEAGVSKKRESSHASGSRHSLDDVYEDATGVVPPTTTSSLLPASTSSTSDPLSSSSLPSPLPPPTTTTETPTTINPADVDSGTTCPICVCEFEEGEDVRILPCDGRHRFHPDCIDPWLLQVSSLCPLCRLDLSGPKDVEPVVVLYGVQDRTRNDWRWSLAAQGKFSRSIFGPETGIPG